MEDVPATSVYWKRRQEFLRELPLFTSAGDDELRAFDRLASEVWVAAGDEVTREGERGAQFVVIADGQAVVERDGHSVAALGPGDFIGDLAALDGAQRDATIRACTPVRLLVLGVDEFDSAMETVPVVREAMAAAARRRRTGTPVLPARSTSHRWLRWWRRRTTGLVLAGVVLAGAVAAGSWVLSQRTQATTIALDDAVARFRAAPAATADDDAAALAPEPGVYTYVTDGSDSVSVFGAKHEYPSRTYAVVRRTGGCNWQVEHRLVDEHVDIHHRCTDARGLWTVADGRFVEFFSKRDGMIYDCRPPGLTLGAQDTVGTVHRATCRKGASVGEFVVTRRAPEALTIDGERVRTERVALRVHMQGRTEGRAAVEFWLHPETGMILMETRHVDTDAKAVFGDVHYDERVTIRLASMRPVR